MIRVTWFETEELANAFIQEVNAEFSYPNDQFQSFSTTFQEVGGTRFGVILSDYEGPSLESREVSLVPVELVKPPYNPYT